MTLDDRKAEVLKAVVEEHIETGQPVGSRVIARRYRLGVSPATIRNEMADLEETGYLDKPHTSSGRVPSDRGYRFYVDELMPNRGLSPDDSRAIESLFRRRVKDVVSLLKETVRTISETSNYLGFILGPESETVTYKSIHLIPITAEQALIVIVTDVGFVESCQIEVPPMPREEMDHISALLSRHLTNLAVEKVADRAYELLREEARRYAQIVEQVMEFLRGLVSEPEHDRLYVGGTANLLSHPEFKDVDKVKDLLCAVESDAVIQAALVKDGFDKDPFIRIGKENEVEAVRDLSLVFGVFSVGNTEGKVGILGPRRMDYSRAVALVRQFEQKLSKYFSADE
ncbi:MAG: heat-inducible transcriptional repressor HrcA [Bacillota bacterium]